MSCCLRKDSIRSQTFNNMVCQLDKKKRSITGDFFPRTEMDDKHSSKQRIQSSVSPEWRLVPAPYTRASIESAISVTPPVKEGRQNSKACKMKLPFQNQESNTLICPLIASITDKTVSPDLCLFSRPGSRRHVPAG